MKSRAIESDPTKQKRSYPYLAKWNAGGSGPFVVLFTSPQHGVIVDSQNPVRSLGLFAEFTAESSFDLYSGVIELSN